MFQTTNQVYVVYITVRHRPSDVELGLQVSTMILASECAEVIFNCPGCCGCNIGYLTETVYTVKYPGYTIYEEPCHHSSKLFKYKAYLSDNRS